MSKSKLVQDAERMYEIVDRLAWRADIWQDRYLYWITVAVIHILEEIY